MITPRLHNGHLLGIVVLLGSFLYSADYPVWHTDVWAHAKYGEAYVKQGFFEHEPLSPFTDKEAPFSHVAWLSQVLYFKLYQFGASGHADLESQLYHGAEMIRVFHLLLMMARFTLLWLAFRRFGGSSAWAVTALVLYLLAAGLSTSIQRPQAFGLFFMSVMLFYLSSQTIPRHALFVIPLCFGLWANMHGTFAMGFAVLGLHTLGRLIERRRFDKEVTLLTSIIVLSVGATLINPHGPWLYWHVVAFSGHPNLKTMLEWHPMKFEMASGNHWPYLMSLILLAFVQFLGGRKIGIAGCLVALPFAIWPWWQARSLLWWWMIAMWLLARIGPGLGERFATMPGFSDGASKVWKFAFGMILIAACVVLAMPNLRLLPTEARPIRSVNLSTPWMFAECLKRGLYYETLASEIKKRSPNGRFEGVIFSSETQGDYLVWALPPEMPVTLYTHAHVFGKPHWDDCLAVKAGNPNSLEILRKLDARILIVEGDERHATICQMIRDSSDWIVVVDEVPPPHSEDEMRPERFIAIRK